MKDDFSQSICSEVVYEEKDDTFSVYVMDSKSEDYIFISSYSSNIEPLVFSENLDRFKLNVEKAEISKLHNNWYRCSITVILKKKSLALIGLPNDKGDYVYLSKSDKSLYFWGVQVEKGMLTPYVKNNNEQLQIALDEKLNTHNNYLYFILAIGFIGLSSFLIFILYLFKISLKPINGLKLSFCIIIVLNCLTENILSPDSG